MHNKGDQISSPLVNSTCQNPGFFILSHLPRAYRKKTNLFIRSYSENDLPPIVSKLTDLRVIFEQSVICLRDKCLGI